jgi:hypothetical protein
MNSFRGKMLSECIAQFERLRKKFERLSVKEEAMDRKHNRMVRWIIAGT